MKRLVRYVIAEMYLEACISNEAVLGNWEQMGKSHVRGGYDWPFTLFMQ